MIIPSYENALLWHERDLANSSAERFTLSHSMILLDDIIIKCDKVLSKLSVDAERMRYNIDTQKGLVMAEKLMITLVDNGMARDVAHEVLRSASMEALDSGENLEDVCARSIEISEIFSRQELADLFKPESHIGFSGQIVDQAIKLARERI
jgi:adenylosuccinate lyase